MHHSKKMFVLSDFHLKQIAQRVTSLTFVVIVMMMITSIKLCDAMCYFPAEYQGEYITQSTVSADNQVQYNHINISEAHIPIWGLCHKRVGSNIILMDETEETICYRCFHLRLMSKNILRVLTSDVDYISKCYTNEEKALASCLSEEQLLDESKNTEIILYKTKEWDWAPISQEYCPIHGRYKFTYNFDNGTEDMIECSSQDSELDSCPSGSSLNLRFKNCAFADLGITFECLGHWKGLRNQNYLAVMNINGDHRLGPAYRCATYFENTKTNIIEVTFSKDSTCRSISQNIDGNGINNQVRNEKLILYPNPYEFGVSLINYCSFPNWLIGDWEHVTVTNNQLIYKDHMSFKTYTMKCIKNFTNHDKDKYMVYSQTQCGEERYQCLKIVRRDQNVFEFQISEKTSQTYSNIICHDIYFSNRNWLTQGRLDSNNIMSPCPISGEFTGLIPDDPELCAKLTSECKSQDIMFYQISACEFNEVYEEREYRCLGQWEENNFVYTYTQRRDIGTYECFVGTVLTDKKILLKEAGEHCSRDGNPYRFGMELNKVATCTISDVFKTTTKQPTHKYSEVATIRSTMNNFESSSKSPVTVPSTQAPQTIVTDRNSVRYSVTNTNVPKENAPPVKTTDRRPPSPASVAGNHLHLSYLLMLLIPFNLCYFSL